MRRGRDNSSGLPGRSQRASEGNATGPSLARRVGVAAGGATVHATHERGGLESQGRPMRTPWPRPCPSASLIPSEDRALSTSGERWANRLRDSPDPSRWKVRLGAVGLSYGLPRRGAGAESSCRAALRTKSGAQDDDRRGEVWHPPRKMLCQFSEFAGLRAS